MIFHAFLKAKEMLFFVEQSLGVGNSVFWSIHEGCAWSVVTESKSLETSGHWHWPLPVERAGLLFPACVWPGLWQLRRAVDAVLAEVGRRASSVIWRVCCSPAAASALCSSILGCRGGASSECPDDVSKMLLLPFITDRGVFLVLIGLFREDPKGVLWGARECH